MTKPVKFEYSLRGTGRPQILLIGNGLEYDSGQVSWGKLVDNLTVSDCMPISEAEKRDVPFPLLYETIVLQKPIPSVLGIEDIKKIEKRLKAEMLKLKNDSNKLLDRLPELGADHVLTTNYSYCLEKAFFPDKDFRKSGTRTAARFNLLPLNDKGKLPNEKYRLHSGYLAANKDGSPAGLWHIHGECHASSGIVIGHDRYGRLLKRMIDCCSSINYGDLSKEGKLHTFKSWPELFLFGDVYVIGFGYAQCEFDLWWLLRRKQRERNGDGKVYFYDKAVDVTCGAGGSGSGGAEDAGSGGAGSGGDRWAAEKRLRDKLLMAHGVQILDCGSTSGMSYADFYERVFEDVKRRILAARCARS